MLARLADLGIRYPRRVLATALLLLVVAGALGAPVASHLSAGGFTDPDSESQRAARTLQEDFRAGSSNLVLQVRSDDGVGSDAARAEGRRLAEELEQTRHVSQVQSYWTSPPQAAQGLRSEDGRSGLVVATVGGDDDQAPKRAGHIAEELTGSDADVTVTAGGIAVAYDQVNERLESDLLRSELVAIPLTVIALIIVFGSLYAALVPLVIGLAAIIGTMATLRGIAGITDVSVYALNLTTALGLALAIDYSLFIVSRYREELRGGATSDDAVRRSMRTAGRTVLFSAVTVALSLSALVLFKVYFLRSFAYAGVAVVVLATIAALVLLPAVLTLLGPKRIDALDVRRGIRRLLGRPEPRPVPVEEGRWYRFAHAVMRRAVPIGLVGTALLIGIGLPFLKADFAYPDDRVLPPDASAHQVGDALREDFPSNAGATLSVVVPDRVSSEAVADYAQTVSRDGAVTSVSSAAGTYRDGRRVAGGDPSMQRDDATYVQVSSDLEPESDAAHDLLADVRDTPGPDGATTLVAGQTADSVDSLHSLGTTLPWVIALIAISMLVVLFLFTGSIVLPLKALVLNTLSLTATFGAMVWIFQEGHLTSWLFPDLTVTDHLAATMPPLMFCLAFGLSMDYEVFLLSRVREEWLRTGDNTEAVALGLGRTGRIITAAAALMSIVFASLATSGIAFMMLFGTGLTLAVLMDATVVRAVIVPAFMRLAGRWNWWAPAPLARLHERIGLHEGEESPPLDVRSRETVSG